MNICLIEECNDKILTFKSGLCRKHYLRNYRYGDPYFLKQNSPNSGRNQNCVVCNVEFYVPLWEDTRNKKYGKRIFCSTKCHDKFRDLGVTEKNCSFCNKKIVIKNYILKRRPNSENFCSKKCHVEYQKTLVENKNLKYKGITSEEGRLRKIEDYREWRTSIYKRDNYTCQRCFSFGGKLNAHHILYFKKFPIFRFDIDNGITLCKNCHKYIHKIQSKRFMKSKKK